MLVRRMSTKPFRISKAACDRFSFSLGTVSSWRGTRSSEMVVFVVKADLRTISHKPISHRIQNNHLISVSSCALLTR